MTHISISQLKTEHRATISQKSHKVLFDEIDGRGFTSERNALMNALHSLGLYQDFEKKKVTTGNRQKVWVGYSDTIFILTMRAGGKSMEESRKECYDITHRAIVGDKDLVEEILENNERFTPEEKRELCGKEVPENNVFPDLRKYYGDKIPVNYILKFDCPSDATDEDKKKGRSYFKYGKSQEFEDRLTCHKANKAYHPNLQFVCAVDLPNGDFMDKVERDFGKELHRLGFRRTVKNATETGKHVEIFAANEEELIEIMNILEKMLSYAWYLYEKKGKAKPIGMLTENGTTVPIKEWNETQVIEYESNKYSDLSLRVAQERTKQAQEETKQEDIRANKEVTLKKIERQQAQEKIKGDMEKNEREFQQEDKRAERDMEKLKVEFQQEDKRAERDMEKLKVEFQQEDKRAERDEKNKKFALLHAQEKTKILRLKLEMKNSHKTKDINIICSDSEDGTEF